MNRIWVVGSSGSGKSRLAGVLAGALGVPHVELDAIHHQPDWEELPLPQFRETIDRRTAEPGWVVDGNYAKVADIVVSRADTVVWLDLPKPLVMRRLAWRTLTRGLLREELWNGNRERLANFIRVDPEKSVLRWAWTRWDEHQERYERLQRQFGGTFVRLRSDDEVTRFVEEFRSRSG